METAGLIVGVTGIAGVFTTCVNLLVRAQKYNSFKDDSRILNVRLNSARVRFELWGSKVGIQIHPEASPQEPKGNHTRVAESIRSKYEAKKVNDTNASQEQDASVGRLSKYSGEHDGPEAKRASGYWMVDDQDHPGMSPYAPSGYKVWRNVKDFGAVGDGRTDDTEAINKAIADGFRCAEECHTGTNTPAVVYFPPGTYLVSSSVIQYYNTQFLGDPNNVPTILAASSFVGLSVFPSNKYVEDNMGW